jgi:hypothetical protein
METEESVMEKEKENPKTKLGHNSIEGGKNDHKCKDMLQTF